jgi:hypothetical protein
VEKTAFSDFEIIGEEAVVTYVEYYPSIFLKGVRKSKRHSG